MTQKIMNNKLQAEINDLKCLVEQQQTQIQTLKNTVFGMPTQSYWKNVKGMYLDENQTSVFYRTIKYRIPITCALGMVDTDIVNSQTEKIWRDNDLLVMESRKPVVAEELFVPEDGGKSVPQISMKVPIYNEENRVIGIWGQTISVVDFPFIKGMHKLFDISKDKTLLEQLKFFLSFSMFLESGSLKERSYQALTQREKQVAYYLLKGATSKMIARTLGISERTIDDHMRNMKKKMRCYSKPQLVSKLFSLCGSLFDEQN